MYRPGRAGSDAGLHTYLLMVVVISLYNLMDVGFIYSRRYSMAEALGEGHTRNSMYAMAASTPCSLIL